MSLPDPLKSLSGATIESTSTWMEVRRAEILELFRESVFGRTPELKGRLDFDVLEEDYDAHDGKAIRKQVAIKVTVGQQELSIGLLIFLPPSARTRPVPVFSLLNFCGNHSIHADPSIILSTGYLEPEFFPAENHRGAQASRFPIDRILAQGYGVVTAYYGDIDPDFHDNFQNGIHPMFDASGDRSADAWASVGAWAWGLSRIMDYLETDGQIDHTKVVVAGHSRLGKSALWAGAQDPRFALIISNESGCTGAAISRGKQGETIKAINGLFPHWFCENYKQYNEREDELPVDQHMLIALIAPRPVYVSSAAEDLWADPQAEFAACVQADPVYRLFGLEGLQSTKMPEPNQPLTEGHIGYHIRTGEHELTEYDWACFLDFADKHLKTNVQ